MAPVVYYFSLVLARVATFVTVFPLLGGQNLPRTVKAGLALALTLVWAQPVLDNLPASALLGSRSSSSCVSHVVALGREVLLGALLGYGLGLFLAPVQIAGEYLTQEMGLSFANQVNPTGLAAAGPLTQILEQLAIAVFFGVDGHHILFGVLHATFAQYPITGCFPDMAMPKFTASAALAQEWGMMLAAPVGFCLFLTTVVLALIGRAAPRMNFFAVGLPLRLGVGLVASFLLMPAWINAIVVGFSRLGDLVAHWG
jgi:flagellar biosynthetic protein FliR